MRSANHPNDSGKPEWDKERLDMLPHYIEWLKTIPPDQLQQYVTDAWAKGQIEANADLHRFFLLEHEKKIRMIPQRVEAMMVPKESLRKK